MVERRLKIQRTTPTTIEVDGDVLLSFAGCDYLGLAHHPAVREAVVDELACGGLSSSASRETTGNRAAHEELERELAMFLDFEEVLLAPSGYLAGAIAAQGLARDHAEAILDAQSHASVRDAVRAADMRAVDFTHASAEVLGERLAERTESGVAVFVEGLYPAAVPSRVPLAEICARVAAHPSPCTLVVDDSQALGVLGARGRGALEEQAVRDPRVVLIGSLAKSLGSHGGFIAATHDRIARMRTSRAHVASSPIPPVCARAASAALAVLRAEPERLQRLRARAETLRLELERLELARAEAGVPVFCFARETPHATFALHRMLAHAGVFVPLVHYPDRADHADGYLRLTVSSEHTEEDVKKLVDELESLCTIREP